jgi:hypothetical protein
MTLIRANIKYIRVLMNQTIKIQQHKRAGGLAWLRYRLDMAGFEGSNPFRPIKFITK